jgi:ribosomal protein S18 acetylase RimI-like enzyme
MEVRSARASELDRLADIWHRGWQDAHAGILPAELARHRTWESFRRRLEEALPRVRVVDGIVGSVAEPVGFCMTQDDEVYQLYVAREARGSGMAAALLADAEETLGSSGVETAWLACAVGNERAARFYERNGWRRVGNMINELPTPDGLFPLDVWRYEKHLMDDRQPAVGVAHVVLQTHLMSETARFMRIIGMRTIHDGPEVSVYELRGGTHLILMRGEAVADRAAPFDLMVDDLRGTHARFIRLGLNPSPIECRPAIDHEVFTVREPAGSLVTFFSSHASGKPV